VSRSIFLKLAADFDAAAIGEAEIQEDEIRLETGDGRQRLRDGAGFTGDLKLRA
jgi:hypothetical protein